LYFSLVDILNQIVPAMTSLNEAFKLNLFSYLNSNLDTDKIKFSVFIVMLFLVFLFVWTPYLKNLNNKIWRTKGMLNMIPMDILSKNESLKNAFISGDILQAVK
jgi:hypothetical protein